MGETLQKPYSTQELMAIVDRIKTNPWQYRKSPFKILDNIYYVGNQWVGAYLIDTGEGLILLDSNFGEVMWLLLENIRTLGFNPKDIRLLLLTHGHFDHIGGARYIQELSGCTTYFPPEDLFFLTERRDLILGPVPDFKVNAVYDYTQTINLGNTSIQPIHSPGHTPGCTSFLFKSRFNSKEHLVAAHGGLGTNGLSLTELRENNLPLQLQQDYRNGLKKLSDLPVDVFLPLHNSYYDIFSLADRDDGSGAAFIRPGDWKACMEFRIHVIDELIAKDQQSL